MPEEDKPESNPTEIAGPTRSAETARALIRKTKRATRRRFPTEDKIRIVMEGVRGEVPVAELCCRESNPDLVICQTGLGPKRHHTLDHASLTNVEGMQRIEL